MSVGFYSGISLMQPCTNQKTTSSNNSYVNQIYTYWNPKTELLDLSLLPPILVKRIYQNFTLYQISTSRLVCKRWLERLESDRIKVPLWHPIIFRKFVKNEVHGEKSVTSKDLPLNTLPNIRKSCLIFPKTLGKTHDIVITQLTFDNKTHFQLQFRPVLSRTVLDIGT
jgi:hypothetical protein